MMIGVELIRPHRYHGVNYPAGHRLLFSEVPMDEATAQGLIAQYVAVAIEQEPIVHEPEEYSGPFSNTIESLVALIKRIARDIESCAPIGVIFRCAGKPKDKRGFLVCDGREVSISKYQDLHRVIGDSQGYAGPGSFRIPAEPMETDSLGRVIFYHIIKAK